jgi:Protein of unknown function (DUF4232)
MTLRPSSISPSSRMRRWKSVGSLLSLTALTAIVLAACGGGDNSSSASASGVHVKHRPMVHGPSKHVLHHPGSPASSVPRPAPTTTTTFLPAGISPPVASGLATCSTSSLSIVMAMSTAASNGQAGVLSFKNTSKKPCELTGYPVVTGITSSGTKQSAASKAAGNVGGYLGNPNSLPVVQLNHGQSVSSVVQANPSSCSGSYNTLDVSPPGSSQTVQISANIADAGDNLPSCDFQVSPVVPGVTLFYPNS